MVKFSRCPECGTFFLIHDPISRYFDNLFIKNKKLNFLCGDCGLSIFIKSLGGGIVPPLGKLLAIQGADYIEDFGEF